MYSIYFSYKLDYRGDRHSEKDAAIMALMQEYGCEPSSSAIGMGVRDLGCMTEDYDRANNLFEELKMLPFAAKVEIHEGNLVIKEHGHVEAVVGIGPEKGAETRH